MMWGKLAHYDSQSICCSSYLYINSKQNQPLTHYRVAYLNSFIHTLFYSTMTFEKWEYFSKHSFNSHDELKNKSEDPLETRANL